jgi:hypothetical protein
MFNSELHEKMIEIQNQIYQALNISNINIIISSEFALSVVMSMVLYLIFHWITEKFIIILFDIQD